MLSQNLKKKKKKVFFRRSTKMYTWLTLSDIKICDDK